MRSALLVGIIVLTSCGGAQKQANREMQNFECKDRAINYTVSHHMGGAELGVQMDCIEQGPRIKRWKVDDKGTRTEDARGMTPPEFDDVWG
jgi:hypothetical protein